MRFNCEIQINNRQLPSLNMKGKKSTRCSLAIGKQSGEIKDSSKLFIHICSLQNKQGNKYKIWNNIQAVFTKFVHEGKFTIQLKEPSLDLCIKAEPSLAKGFLKLLKLTLENKNLDKLPFSHLNPVKQNQIEKPKTKLIISHRKDYPLTSSFPYTLESLTITCIKLTRIEKRIINLRKLSHLDISQNQIVEIPLELSLMNNLSVLNLNENKISTLPNNFFDGKIKETLVSLNLSHNEIEMLPISIFKLKKLDTLILSSNKLTKLSLYIDRLIKLKFLNISQNLLEEIPASILNLYLESLDVSGNPFNSEIEIKMIYGQNKCVKTLKEMAALSCIQQDFHPQPDVLPLTLCNYLDSYLRCMCSKILLNSCLLATVLTSLKKFPSATMSGRTSVPAVGSFCSDKCWNKFKRYIL